jgi:hypothetical protein
MFDLTDLQQIIDLVSHAVVEIRDRSQLLRI